MEDSHAHASWLLGLKEILKDEKLLREPAKFEPKEEDGETVEGKAVVPTPVDIDPSNVEKLEKAMNLIVLNVGDHVHCTTATAMWSLLERLYMSKSLSNRISCS